MLLNFPFLYNCSSEFLIGSPTYKLGVVIEGGAIKIIIMSVAACLKKSSIFTFEKVTLFVKKFTLSTYLSSFVLGK